MSQRAPKTHCIRGHERSTENLSKPRKNGSQVCLVCKREKEKQNRDSPEFRNYSAGYNRDWRRKNPDKCRATSIRYKYGLEPEDLNNILVAQENKGAVCRLSFSDDSIESRPYVDHCHTRGSVRGVLCMKCNSGLGQFEDDANRLRAAADYLDRSAAGTAIPTN